jgi:putative aminopeptidase FrvX
MISEARAALATVLENGGLRATEYVPERITPPLAVVQPSGDWVTSGDTFGSFRVGFEVTLIVQTASNQVVSSHLDELVDETLTAISDASGFYASQVSAPSLLSVQNAEYLSTTITVYQNTQL